MMKVGPLLCVLCSAARLVSADDRPNFVFIFTDDLGFGDLACYGHPYAKTPNIDRLAQEGTRFKQFHVTGNVCPHSRTGFMTGRNPSWFRNRPTDFGFLGVPTVTNFLQDAGYFTGHIGKWNIGADPVQDARDYGIDDLRITGSIGNDPRGREGERFDEAVDFLEERSNSDQPFYLNLWIYTPHTPVTAPQSFIESFSDVEVDRDDFEFNMQERFDELERRGADLDESMRLLYADIMAMDAQVGRLLGKLDELGLSDNTVVVFSSDNGPARPSSDSSSIGYAGGLRGGKHTYYEGGTRVPFIVRWPGMVPAGRTDDVSIMFGTDWLTTVCSLAGVEVPVNIVEGEDMSDVWLGNARPRVNPIFWRVLSPGGHGRVYMRYGRWKLHKREDELYDLQTDVEERDNLYTSRPAIRNAMLESMEIWESSLPTDLGETDSGQLPFNPSKPVEGIVPPDIDGAFPGPTTPTSPPPTNAPVSTPTAVPVTSAPVQVPPLSDEIDFPAMDFVAFDERSSEKFGNCPVVNPVDVSNSVDAKTITGAAQAFCMSDCAIGWTEAGEYVDYGFATTLPFQDIVITVRVSSFRIRPFRLELWREGVRMAQSDELFSPDRMDFDIYEAREWTIATMEAGAYIVRVLFVEGSMNLCSVRVEGGQSSTPVPVAATPAPAVATPAPVIVTPAPVVVTLTPVASTPAPVVVTPAPVVSTPAPVVSPPSPVAVAPVPVVSTPVPIAATPAPVVSTPAPVGSTSPPILISLPFA